MEPKGEEAVEEDIIEVEEEPQAESAPPPKDDTDGKAKKKKEKPKEKPVEEPIQEEIVEAAQTAPVEEAPKKKDKAPKFSSELKDQTVVEGSEVKLTCKVKGQPTPEVTWQFNGSDIKDNSVYSVSFDGEKCILKIKETKLEYAGAYTVKVGT